MDPSKPAQPGGCVRCHPGYGAKPSKAGKMTEADYNNIDCLLCHAPGYKRTVGKVGDQLKLIPTQDTDVLKAAQSVQKPTSEMCLRCHAFAAGGLNFKHGVVPTAETDVHAAKGIQCVQCHITKDHRIAGGADIKAREFLDVGVTVACENCHTGSPHKGNDKVRIDDHAKRLACQACHIPGVARDPKQPTLVFRDYTKPVLNEKVGLYGPTEIIKGNLKPVYRWWNRYTMKNTTPVGSITDKTAKIYPYKTADFVIIADAETGKAVYLKSGVYSITGDINASAKKGAEDSKMPYSGKWKPLEETLHFTLNHQVAPKSGALSCKSCHSPDGVMDFQRLGYSAEKVKELMQYR
ncbi:MAG: hypothetical protein LLG97_02865 [Deltaproteobacteria bacterium]|nr:hypothetical protein [Deltaproteobacteria bacterium]